MVALPNGPLLPLPTARCNPRAVHGGLGVIVNPYLNRSTSLLSPWRRSSGPGAPARPPRGTRRTPARARKMNLQKPRIPFADWPRAGREGARSAATLSQPRRRRRSRSPRSQTRRRSERPRGACAARDWLHRRPWRRRYFRRRKSRPRSQHRLSGPCRGQFGRGGQIPFAAPAARPPRRRRTRRNRRGCHCCLPAPEPGAPLRAWRPGGSSEPEEPPRPWKRAQAPRGQTRQERDWAGRALGPQEPLEVLGRPEPPKAPVFLPLLPFLTPLTPPPPLPPDPETSPWKRPPPHTRPLTRHQAPFPATG